MFGWRKLQRHYPVIRIYDNIGNMSETHEHAGDFKEP
jgi:hypothetical protein